MTAGGRRSMAMAALGDVVRIRRVQVGRARRRARPARAVDGGAKNEKRWRCFTFYIENVLTPYVHGREARRAARA